MKILLTHRYFWPDTVNCGQILRYVAEHYSSEGHTVEVITSLPSYNLDSLKIHAQKNETIKNIKIRRIKLITEGKNPFKKILNGLKLVSDFLEKTILKPNNLNYPISRTQFINSLR